jgi:Zn-dependent protease with chaperone function
MVKENWVYFFWFLFYLMLFGFLTGGVVILFYLISFIIAFSPLSEKLWRIVSGVRPLRLKQEKQRLIPLFNETYKESLKVNPYLSKDIKLHIQENMDINAFAFGRETLVLTKGSIDLLGDEALKALIAHELGHFTLDDTIMSLFASVANLPMSLLMRVFYKIERSLEATKGAGIVQIIFGFFFAIFKGIEFISSLMIMHHTRKREYMADVFARKAGFGKEMADVLIQIYQISMDSPKSIKEQLKATHPPITKRIERIERLL